LQWLNQSIYTNGHDSAAASLHAFSLCTFVLNMQCILLLYVLVHIKSFCETKRNGRGL